MSLISHIKNNIALDVYPHATGSIPELVAKKDSLSASVLGIATDTSAFVTYSGTGEAFISYGGGKAYTGSMQVAHDGGYAQSIAYASSNMLSSNGLYTKLAAGQGTLLELQPANTFSPVPSGDVVKSAAKNIVAPFMLLDAPAYRAGLLFHTVKLTLLDTKIATGTAPSGTNLYINVVLVDADTGDWYAAQNGGLYFWFVSDGTNFIPGSESLTFTTGNANFGFNSGRNYSEIALFAYHDAVGVSIPMGTTYIASTLKSISIEIT